MKIIKSSLVATLEDICSNHPEQLPDAHRKQSYFDRYKQLAEKLDNDFHMHVVAGSAAADGGILTDHGSDHVQTVIKRVTALLDDPDNSNALNGYEIFLLLCAIHFHDLGNINGRNEHEKRVSKMMKHVESHFGDNIEKLMIRKIAEAHGGRVNGDLDTIVYLDHKIPVFGIDIRPRMLAAILKFADEISDDSNRANRVLMELDAIPKKSLIYHKYASSLHSVMLRESCKSVELNYVVNINEMCETIPKLNPQTKKYKKVFLLDEIFERLNKMYLERLYCNRFMMPVAHVHSIVVMIKTTKVCEDIGEVLPKISFRLEERGYPELSKSGIYELSDELENWEKSGTRLTGKTFAKSIAKLKKDGV